MSAESETEREGLLEQFREWLRDRHLPVTRQRDLVARAVFDSASHLSVEEIESTLRRQGHRIGTATIYRSLEVLVQSGLVRGHDFGEGFRRFEGMKASAKHGHLICTRCSKVIEFSTERLERILPIVADEHGFRYHRHRVEIQGLCRKCQEVDIGALVQVAQRQQR